MASLRRRLSKWALGDGDENIKRLVSLEVNRGSIDSGYHSISRKQLSQSSSLLPTSDSPDKPSRNLHKALSTTFGFLADTVRQGVASFHQESSDKDDNTSEPPEFATPSQTPKKRRSSLFSSIRGRKNAFSPRLKDTTTESIASPGSSPVPPRNTDGKAPILDVPIPDSCLNDDSSEQKNAPEIASEAKVLWPSPTRVAVSSDDPYIDRDELSSRIRHFVTSTLAESTSPKDIVSYPEDKGYVAESESGAEPSESDAISSPDGQHIASNLSGTTSPSNSNQKITPYARADDGSGSPKMVAIPPRGSSAPSEHPVEGRQMISNRLPSFMYEADAELSETSPGLIPSMGSRATWEEARADRSRRYRAALGEDAQSDSDLSAKTNFPNSPRSCEGNDYQKIEAIGEEITRAPYPVGELRYAVEAAERQPGMDLFYEENDILPDLRYAVEAAERQPGTNFFDEENEILPLDLGGRASTSMLSMCLTEDDIMELGPVRDPKLNENSCSFSDSETDLSDNDPSQQTVLSQPEDAFEAGLRAAGLSIWSYPKQPSITAPRDNGQTFSNPDIPDPPPSPRSHFRSASSLSEATNDSCAITTNSPSCEATLPFPVLHVRSEPARHVSSDIKALNNAKLVDIPLTGPENTGPVPSSDLDAADRDKSQTISAEVELKTAVPELPEKNEGQGETRSRETTPGRAFNAARLPRFHSVSPVGLSLKSRDSLRRDKNKHGRIPLSKAVGNVSRNQLNQEDADSPEFTVRHFKSVSGESSPYAGLELDPVSFGVSKCQESLDSSPTAKDRKAVCFAKDIEIIEPTVESEVDTLDSADAQNESTWQPFLKGFEKELEEKQELALRRLKKKIESDDPHEYRGEKENIDPDEVHKVMKPRWRVPSKITDTII